MIRLRTRPMHAYCRLLDRSYYSLESGVPVEAESSGDCWPFCAGREKGIVLNLETIRQLIASDQTILFSVLDPRGVAPC